MKSPTRPKPAGHRLALVDDDPEFRAELVKGLAAQPGWRVVAACASAEQALREIPGQRPDLVLIDIRLPPRRGLPDWSGLRLVGELKRRTPEAKLVMLSVSHETDDIISALQDGASGYISKGESLLNLLEQIAVVVAGGSFMSPSIARKCIEWFQENHPQETDPTLRPTQRELDVLEQTAQGRSHAEVAAALGISPNTVRNHFANIYEKFGVNSAAAAVHKARWFLRLRERLRGPKPPPAGLK